jgi:hypothetical protein
MKENLNPQKPQPHAINSQENQGRPKTMKKEGFNTYLMLLPCFLFGEIIDFLLTAQIPRFYTIEYT